MENGFSWEINLLTIICYYYYSTIGKVLFIYFPSHFLQAACQSTITMLFYVSVL